MLISLKALFVFISDTLLFNDPFSISSQGCERKRSWPILKDCTRIIEIMDTNYYTVTLGTVCSEHYQYTSKCHCVFVS